MILRLFKLSTLLLILGFSPCANAASLEALVSSNESTRATALKDLEREFASQDPSGLESGYQRYGNDLLPYLYRSIGEYDDRNTRHALEALFHMALVHRMGSHSAPLSEELMAMFKELEHIPDPATYSPLKDVLILRLTESPYETTRALSAKVLAMSFGPIAEIEDLLFEQLINDRSRRVRRGIMEGVALLVTRAGYLGTEYLSVLRVRGTYSHFDKGVNVGGGSWLGILLPDQPVVYERRATGVTLDFTIDPVSEEEYVVHYRLYDLNEGTREAGESSLKGAISGQVEGRFGSTVNIDVEAIDIKIETTLFVEKNPKCLKRQILSCHR